MLDVRKQIESLVDKFNERMVAENKPVRAKLTQNGIEIRYSNVLESLRNILSKSGIKFEVIVTDNAIMIKTTVDEIKNTIASHSGLEPDLLKNARFEPNDRGDYDLVTVISMG